MQGFIQKLQEQLKNSEKNCQLLKFVILILDHFRKKNGKIVAIFLTNLTPKTSQITGIAHGLKRR